jgi:hypothetical protein
MSIEHEYQRLGSWAYLAALDVHRAKIFGRCETNSGIAPFDRLVDQVMKCRPYCQARRVFWIVDNGSVHRGPNAAQRLLNKYLTLVHGPIHASWLNQIEIYFLIVQRKALTPSDFTSLMDLSRRPDGIRASLSDHRATFRMAVHTTELRRPVKQIGPTSFKGSLKYVTEYMKRRTKVVKNSSNTCIRSLCSPTSTVSSPRWFQLEEGVIRVADGRGIEDLDSPTAATCLPSSRR